MAEGLANALYKIGIPDPEQAPPDWDAVRYRLVAMPDTVPWRYGRVYQREDCGRERLRVGVDERQIDLLIALAAVMPEPQCVLYVLHTPVGGHEEGRYEGPLATAVDVGVFLGMHEAFLERDARHDVWVIHPLMDAPAPQLVYDRHNLIYAYGPLDAFETVLRQWGFGQGAVSIPSPHAHNYHHEYNRMNDELLAYWPWRRTPLRSADGQ